MFGSPIFVFMSREMGHEFDELDVGRQLISFLGEFDVVRTEEEYFHTGFEEGRKGDFDVIGYSGSETVFLELKSSSNHLSRGFNQLEKGLSHLQRQGYDPEGYILVFDDVLLDYRDALDQLPAFYTFEELNEVYDGGAWNVVSASVSNDLDALLEEDKNVSRVTKYDWDLLEARNLVERDGDQYRGTESLEERLNEVSDTLLHTSPRISYLLHPKDFRGEKTLWDGY